MAAFQIPKTFSGFYHRLGMLSENLLDGFKCERLEAEKCAPRFAWKWVERPIGQMSWVLFFFFFALQLLANPYIPTGIFFFFLPETGLKH